MNWVSQIKSLLPEGFRENESMRNWTTFRCEAKAKILLSPKNIHELSLVLSALKQMNVPWRIIGRGSNLLIRDGGYSGALIELSQGFHKIEPLTILGPMKAFRVGAGVPNGTLLKMLREKNLSGFEFSFGIPGSIGGGIRMNAGTPMGWFSQVISDVEAMDEDGKVFERKVSEKDFTYRDFPLGRGWVILGGIFQFVERSNEEIENKIEKAKLGRSHQPLEFPNIGSVFKNPPNDYAGRLIELCGLKGERVGDAEISTKHANFIVNLGNAKTKDVLSLIQKAQERVHQKFSIHLETEVHTIGEE